MFCFQCEQTIGGKGCTKAGNCGKNAEVAALQDLLIYELKGIGFYGEKLLEKGIKIDDETDKFVMDATFSTLTNVNFDPERFACPGSSIYDTTVLAGSMPALIPARNHGGLRPPPYKATDYWFSSGATFMMYTDWNLQPSYNLTSWPPVRF